MPDQAAEAFRPSPQQEAQWLTHPEGPTGRTQAVATLDGSLQGTAVAAALTRAVERHEILRTTFVHRPGISTPLQLVHDELAPAWETVDLASAAAEEQEARIGELAQAALRAPMDLAVGPLVRGCLITRGPDRHVLILTCSALCADASSIPAVLAEVAAHSGMELQLPPEPLQYADFAEWQHEVVAGDDEDARAGASFWAELDGLAPPAVPFTRVTSSASHPIEVPVVLDTALREAIAGQAERYGASVEAFLQACWHAALARITGDEDVVSELVNGTPREDDLEGAVGPFARPLPVRTAAPLTATFAELLAQTTRARSEVLAWEDHAPVGAGDRPAIGFSSSAGFTVEAGGLRLTLERVSESAQPFLLCLACHDLEGEPRVRIAYDPEAFDAERAERLALGLERVIRSAAEDPGTVIGRLEILGEPERHQLLVEFNDTTVSWGAGRVEELFAARAAKNPDERAVVDAQGSITYGELDAQANRLAHRLCGAGVGPDEVVGLCTDRSIDMVVGLLGILKAGAAFLPLHLEHPPARLEHQLRETGARVVVTQPPLTAHLPDIGGDVVVLPDDVTDGDLPDTAPEHAGDPDGLAYVIYTSGSTGRPKGVAVTHANLSNYIGDMLQRLGAEAEPLAFGMVTALSTDLGHTAVFPALCSGGTLVLVPPAEAADGAALARRLGTTPVDVLKITPSHLGAVLATDDPQVLPRRWLVVGGERLGWDLVTRVRRLGSCTILNHYGPTETTVGSCAMTVTGEAGVFPSASVPIGRPIANTRCYVLDEWAAPVPVGAPGRLFIGGAGVARGYVAQRELTAERFVADPFVPDGARMYDTGDVARWLRDGTLEFLGRVDEQVKIRGYRVEPGEVEEALREHPLVREAAVVVREDVPGDPRLVAYCANDAGLEQSELREHLSGLLPDYMIPAAIVPLDALPLTASGKVDRQALPEPTVREGDEDGRVAPRTPLEEAVAAIWSEVLGIDHIGVDDDFFALGGHSLLAAQVVAQVRSDFAVEVPLHSLFTSPTVASLSVEIGRLIGAADEDETAQVMAELEGLSSEEAERLLAEESSRSEDG